MSEGKQLDVRIENGGAIILFHPLTKAANDWIEKWIPDDGPRSGDAIVIEGPYSKLFMNSLQDGGLVVGV